MSHGLDSCVPLLRRWGQLTAKPMPTDWASFQRTNSTEALLIRDKDPELFQLLSGSASATLRADALSGSLSPVTPDPQKIAAEDLRKTVQSLADSKPFGGRDENGRIIAPNFTDQMKLVALDSTTAERLKAEAAKSITDGGDNKVAAAEAARKRAALASLNGLSGRIN